MRGERESHWADTDGRHHPGEQGVISYLKITELLSVKGKEQEGVPL